MGSRQGERVARSQCPSWLASGALECWGGHPQGRAQCRADGCASHPAVQRTVLADEELLLSRLRDIRQVSGCGRWPLGAAGFWLRLLPHREGPHGHSGGQLAVLDRSALSGAWQIHLHPNRLPAPENLGLRLQTPEPLRGAGRKLCLPSSGGGSAWGPSQGPWLGACGGAWHQLLGCALLSTTPPSPQMSLRQMSQTRFYLAESRPVAPRVSLFVGGLPPGLSPQEYSSLLDEAVATKGVITWAGLGLLVTGDRAGDLRQAVGAAG